MTNESLSQPVGDLETTLVVTESKSFTAFDEWMDAQLDQLVAQWIHTAAPNASLTGRGKQSFGRQNSVR